MSFNAKDSQVQERQLKVQRLVIPFKIVGNASAASVVQSTDEPSILFLKTEGVDDITGALDSGDVATYSVSPNNANCTFNVLVKIKETIDKVQSYRCVRRSAVLSEADDIMIVALGNADGVVQNSSVDGDKIMLTIDGELSLAASNTLNAQLEVEYSVK